MGLHSADYRCPDRPDRRHPEQQPRGRRLLGLQRRVSSRAPELRCRARLRCCSAFGCPYLGCHPWALPRYKPRLQSQRVEPRARETVRGSSAVPGAAMLQAALGAETCCCGEQNAENRGDTRALRHRVYEARAEIPGARPTPQHLSLRRAIRLNALRARTSSLRDGSLRVHSASSKTFHAVAPKEGAVVRHE